MILLITALINKSISYSTVKIVIPLFSSHLSVVAYLLSQAFVGNQSTCLKIQPKQVMKIVQLIAEHKEKVPEFLDLLCAIVKVEGMDMALKRNQAFVMKFFMQYYNKISNVLDESLANKWVK